MSPDDDWSKIVVVDLVEKTPYEKKKKLYEHAWKFQDTWTTQLPWAKWIFDDNGQIHQVHSIVCTFVEGKERLLAPNWTFSWNTKVVRRLMNLGPGFMMVAFSSTRLCSCEEWTMLHYYQLPFFIRPLASWCFIQAKMEICPICCCLSSSCKWSSNDWLWELERLVSAIENEICFSKTLDYQVWLGMVEVMHKVLLEAIKATFITISFIMVNANKFIAIHNT